MSRASFLSLGFFARLKTFWRSPSLTLARFILRRYIHSGWMLGDIVSVVALYAIFFLNFGGDVVYFYTISGIGIVILTLLGTALMVLREMNARLYLPLARLTSRTPYVGGLILATGVVRFFLFFFLLLLAMLYSGSSPHLCTPVCIEGATLSNILLGAVGLLANCVVVAALTITSLLSLGTKRSLAVFLCWAVAVLYSNAGHNSLATFLSFTRVPLIPLSIAYSFGTTASIGWDGFLALFIEGIYIVALVWVAHYWLNKRDLLLQ
jgi:hypothetical protein